MGAEGITLGDGLAPRTGRILPDFVELVDDLNDDLDSASGWRPRGEVSVKTTGFSQIRRHEKTFWSRTLPGEIHPTGNPFGA
jgi:hypothetical protein